MPSPHLVAELTDLPAGTALDAGCGTGADALWLAQEGWQVTAVSWVVADVTVWEPPLQYDLVTPSVRNCRCADEPPGLADARTGPTRPV